MKKCTPIALGFASAIVYVACVDYSDPNAGVDAGAPPPSPAAETAADASARTTRPTETGAPSTCASRSFRGGGPNAVVCPGTTTCECGDADVCCLQQLDAPSGTCTSLAACRALAFQCDGPEDCADGGVCCLEDRSGGGASCKSSASCTAGKRLCRTDGDCVSAQGGPRCAPIDLGAPGVDDVGLDGIIGVCGN